MIKQTIQLPREEYDRRIERVQARMKEQGIDLLIAHACECESAAVRYLTNFWAVFDFVGVLVPAKGKAILLTGGPESYDFSVQFAQIDDVRVHPLYVETCAPEWDKPVNAYDYSMILEELRGRMPIKRIGIANVNTIPHVVYADIEKGANGAEIVPAEDIILEERMVKSDGEILLLKEGYRITEEALKQTIELLKPGVRELELLNRWKALSYEMGAEGFGYPCWVTSGPNTFQSLCKSTDRQIGMNEMVQFSVGAKYNGYCGNIGRVAVLGKLPQVHEDMIRIAGDCLNETIESMGPGVAFAEIYDKFQKRLNKYGFGGLSLYGPAHSTGLQECEAPWVDNRTSRVLLPNMVLNIDIWIADNKYGVRLEDGVLITENGLEQLTTWHRDIIRID
ncbi:MAG: M24 family metallopeptidase [Candidatus Excrementavichristensenella sp.]|jgi:Xaa-Pro aminopeptidase